MSRLRAIVDPKQGSASPERIKMLERQREGIAKAKADGKYKGRKPTARAEAANAIRLFQKGKLVAHIARSWA